MHGRMERGGPPPESQVSGSAAFRLAGVRVQSPVTGRGEGTAQGPGRRPAAESARVPRCEPPGAALTRPGPGGTAVTFPGSSKLWNRQHFPRGGAEGGRCRRRVSSPSGPWKRRGVPAPAPVAHLPACGARLRGTRGGASFGAGRAFVRGPSQHPAPAVAPRAEGGGRPRAGVSGPSLPALGGPGRGWSRASDRVGSEGGAEGPAAGRGDLQARLPWARVSPAGPRGLKASRLGHGVRVLGS